ncbi:MAG: hypothetical protein ACI92Z_000162 [Paracoccaceae bacterium]|jgi:hypothetical protein
MQIKTFGQAIFGRSIVKPTTKNPHKKQGGDVPKAKKLQERMADRKQWPRPINQLKTQPHFLFLVTPPNSGSTAMAKLLNSSQRTTLLHDNGEAQWLVPGLCRKNRWNPDLKVNYASVKAVWLKQFQYLRDCVGDCDVVIEKSPANMIRLDKLIGLFDNVSIVASNRNPYANISSKGHRYGNFAERSAAEREETVEKLAEQWQLQSQTIADIVDRHKCPLVTYEDFCVDPGTLIKVLSLPEGVVDTMDISTNVLVKDYGDQKIRNQNARQIDLLSTAEKARIQAVLATKPELLARFGYALEADKA